MQAKWRLLILLGYALFLAWQFADVIVSSTGIEGFLSFLVLLLFALAPLAFLCLIRVHEPAMGIAALIVAAFGVWAYGANNGDPIGLAIIIIYQFCLVGIGFVAIVIGAAFLEKKS